MADPFAFSETAARRITNAVNKVERLGLDERTEPRRRAVIDTKPILAKITDGAEGKYSFEQWHYTAWNNKAKLTDGLEGDHEEEKDFAVEMRYGSSNVLKGEFVWLWPQEDFYVFDYSPDDRMIEIDVSITPGSTEEVDFGDENDEVELTNPWSSTCNSGPVSNKKVLVGWEDGRWIAKGEDCN